MNLFTHFKLTAEQLEPAYQDNKEQILTDWPTFKKDFFAGKKILQCDERGEISLNVFHQANSKEVNNPYQEKLAVTKPTQPAEPIKDKRKVYIDSILEFIKLEIEEDKLMKLIQVIDLVNEDQGETNLQDILALKD